MDEAGIQLSFPVEVRVVATDDIPLSTASGRATGYIAVHVYKGTPYDAYFQGVERIMDSYGGRPHWGKMHFQRAETLAERYPRWDEFQAFAGAWIPRAGSRTSTSSASSAPSPPDAVAAHGAIESGQARHRASQIPLSVVDSPRAVFDLLTTLRGGTNAACHPL